ncbi:MAG: class I SAM-dependent methyltransferase [Mesorhizobium sp.]|uniref:class I SAM-dependent methyltransferase n=1 Tax=Mesorhizobium sp. TaxID=1871066 RepID=UPI0011FA9932|nr:class I SAM-dependent methyltransferase [Mesorhizobium sp.]TIP29392.1 MAG: class I SAM-dependent methyltransferase [Mesorhizobium sp.]
MRLEEALEKSRQVEGWLSAGEQALLYDLALSVPGDGAIVELGAWLGKSTIMLAAGSMQGSKPAVYSVDSFVPTGEGAPFYYSELRDRPQDYLPIFLTNIRNAGVSSVVKPVKSLTVEAAKGWAGPRVQLLFIDADHAYRSVRDDFLAWAEHCGRGSRVVFHDYGRFGVSHFVDQLRLTKVITNVNVIDSALYGEVAVTGTLRVKRRLDLCPSLIPRFLKGFKNTVRFTRGRLLQKNE